jgi:hypothetical protein
VRFTQEELFQGPIPNGTYPAQIRSAHEAQSRGGHPMIVVWLKLDGQKGAGRNITDYFVTDGVSAHALAVARRRLLSLFRACGLDPAPDVEADLHQLEERRVEVDVEVNAGEGPENRVLRYRQA